MKTTPEKFTAGGFVHEQIEREGDIAIFRRFPVKGGMAQYDVVRIQEEMYPGNEKWGTDGFTFTLPEQARAKFEEMREAQKPSYSPPPARGSSDWSESYDD